MVNRTVFIGFIVIVTTMFLIGLGMFAKVCICNYSVIP